MRELEATPIKDIKPQLLWVGRILGMDLYIDMCGQKEGKYYLAQVILERAIANYGEKDTDAKR